MKLIRVIAVLVVLGAVAAAGFHWWPRPKPPAPAAVKAPPAVELERQDLSTDRTMEGTLGYGAARPVTGGGAGIVTWLPQPGAVIRRGHQLYRVDDRPVPLFYGGIPLYRPLTKANTTGRDVRVLADNLEALGYRIGARRQTAVPGASVLTASLIDALKRWQRDLGLKPTGTLAPSDVVVQRGAVRVDSVAVQPGVAANVELMSVTSPAKVITVEAEPADAAGIDRGDRVGVASPDGGAIPAKVTAVGTELKAAEQDSDGPPQLAISVTVDDPAKLKRFDAGPMDVIFPGKKRADALVAPVPALVALSEGGYALQIEGGPLVPVKTGMFAKGMVEVKGEGLAEGVRVVTAG